MTMNVHFLAPVAAVLLAACTAVATPEEEYGSTESNIEAPTATKAAKAPGALSCGSKKVVVPTALPDVTKCINDGDAIDKASCNGWTPVGPRLTESAELRSAADYGAQLYVQGEETASTTLCLYLYRGDRAVSQGSLNGVHCYDKASCEVCWWDAETTAGVAPTVANLKPQSADKCSNCHRNGPLLPKAVLWDEANSYTSALNFTCAANGGPTWFEPGPGWLNTTPEPAGIVKAPESCKGTGGCHTQFASGPGYCAMLGHAMEEKGGSMYQQSAFADLAECLDFRGKMGCNTKPTNANEPWLDCETDYGPAAP